MKTFTTTPSHLLLLNVTVRILKRTREHQTVMDRYMWRMILIFNILILIISPSLFISTLPYLPHIALFDVKVVAPQVTVRHNRDPVIYGWWCAQARHPGPRARLQVAVLVMLTFPPETAALTLLPWLQLGWTRTQWDFLLQPPWECFPTLVSAGDMLGLQPGALSSAAMLCVCSLGSLLMIRIRIHYTSKVSNVIHRLNSVKITKS